MTQRQSYLSGAPGQILITPGVNPGINTNYVVTLSAVADHRLLYLKIQLTNSAVVIARVVRLEISNGTTAFFRIYSSIIGSANQVLDYIFMPGVESLDLTATRNVVQTAIPDELWIPKGCTLSVIDEVGDPGDVFTDIVIVSEMNYSL